jgi:hypothetical protein
MGTRRGISDFVDHRSAGDHAGSFGLAHVTCGDVGCPRGAVRVWGGQFIGGQMAVPSQIGLRTFALSIEISFYGGQPHAG